MSQSPEKKFDECGDCRFFNRVYGHVGSICKGCTIGEYFEFRINDSQPNDDELMRMYARMPKDD